MREKRKRPLEFLLLIVCSLGAVVTVIPLLVQHGLRASSQLVVAIGTGVIVIGALMLAYVGFSALSFRRVTDNAFRNAADVASDMSYALQSPLHELLIKAATDVAGEQDVDLTHVRAALFRMSGDRLRIVAGLSWHIDNTDERQIRMAPGEGSAGSAYLSRSPHVAIYHKAQNDTTLKDSKQRSRVHPDLKWIISTPILDHQKQVLGVLNVDCLLEERAPEQLENSVGTLLYWAHLAGLLLGARGTEVAQGGRSEVA